MRFDGIAQYLYINKQKFLINQHQLLVQWLHYLVCLRNHCLKQIDIHAFSNKYHRNGSLYINVKRTLQFLIPYKCYHFDIQRCSYTHTYTQDRKDYISEACFHTSSHIKVHSQFNEGNNSLLHNSQDLCTVHQTNIITIYSTNSSFSNVL